ncbi:hypothetical protein L7F22_068644, partial [Adiantum nelumboides]|nr:hypothetical protein [Adiantum nelumboides]
MASLAKKKKQESSLAITSMSSSSSSCPSLSDETVNAIPAHGAGATDAVDGLSILEVLILQMLIP